MSFVTKEQMERAYAEYNLIKGKKDICISTTLNRAEQGLVALSYKSLVANLEIWISRDYDMVMEAYNNLEVVAPDGKTWFMGVIQHSNNTRDCDRDCNCHLHQMSTMALMLFGIMVDGDAYVFTTAQMRDWFVEAVNTKKQMRLPVCALCSCECDNEYGNNPFPLAPLDKHCCDECNTEQVIPHRLAQEAKKAEIKPRIKKECMTKWQVQIKEHCEANGNEYFTSPGVSPLETTGMAVIREQSDVLTDKLNGYYDETDAALDDLCEAMYTARDNLVEADFEGYYNGTEAFKAENQTLTGRFIEEQDRIGERYLAKVFPLRDQQGLLWLQYKALERKAADDLANTLALNDTTDSDHSSNSSNSKKAKKLGAKQAQTRNANKTKQAAIEERKAFELKEAECAKYRAEQERKAKQAKLLKKQKKEREGKASKNVV